MLIDILLIVIEIYLGYQDQKQSKSLRHQQTPCKLKLKTQTAKLIGRKKNNGQGIVSWGVPLFTGTDRLNLSVTLTIMTICIKNTSIHYSKSPKLKDSVVSVKAGDHHRKTLRIIKE